MILEIVLISVFLALVYAYLMSPYSFWDRTCVPVLKPKYPVFGNYFETTFSLKSIEAVQIEIYNKFPNERFVGTFTFTTPTLFVRDPGAVDRLMTRDFAYAPNRGNAANSRATKISKHLFNANDDDWKELRSKLTPAFSMGKLKGMHGQVLECADALLKTIESLGNGGQIEVKDLIERFTTDVIASCAFGLNLESLNDPNCLFRTFGKATFTYSTSRKIFTSLRQLTGDLFRRLGIHGGIPLELVDAFVDAVNRSLEYRKKKGVVRPDFLHLMKELEEKDEELINRGELDPDHPDIFDRSSLISNAFVFFVAGFETTATTISFAMYELALKDDIQNRLHSEIVQVSSKYGGELTFDAFYDMKFLDQVIAETLRIHSPVPTLIRRVAKAYQVPGTEVVMPANSLVSFPICAIQLDPAHFPDPHRFDPDRFSQETGQTIAKGTYLPFGGGPRMCIGVRFAKLATKVALASIILKYKIMKCDKTQVPIKYDKVSLLTVPESGIWLKVEPRTAVGP